MTERDTADRREMILAAAIALLEERGFHATGIDEIGAAAGISGPGVYRHFPNKAAVLTAVADRVSDLLLAGARQIVAGAASDTAALEELVRSHARFAVDDRSLLAVYLQEERSIPEPDRRRIRRTQRRYVQEWVDVMERLRPEVPAVAALTAVHAAIGLINSIVYFDTGLAADDLAAVLERYALAALGAVGDAAGEAWRAVGTMEQIDLAGTPSDLYVARPVGEPPWSGVLVLHEAFGLNDDIKRITDRFASHGYLAVAPDLIEGGRVRCLIQAFRDLRRGDGPIAGRARAALAWTARHPDVLPGQVGAAGFCLGGAFSLLLGSEGTARVVSDSYGKVFNDASLRSLCPVVASYGGRDLSTRRDRRRLEEALEESGIAHDLKVYPDAGHSFQNQAEGHRVIKFIGRPLLAVDYDAAASEDAWRRIFTFFGEYL